MNLLTRIKQFSPKTWIKNFARTFGRFAESLTFLVILQLLLLASMVAGMIGAGLQRSHSAGVCKQDEHCWVLVFSLAAVLPFLGMVLLIIGHHNWTRRRERRLTGGSAYDIELRPRRTAEWQAHTPLARPTRVYTAPRTSTGGISQTPLACPTRVYTAPRTVAQASRGDVPRGSRTFAPPNEVWSRRAAIMAAQDPPPPYSGRVRNWETVVEQNQSITLRP